MALSVLVHHRYPEGAQVLGDFAASFPDIVRVRAHQIGVVPCDVVFAWITDETPDELRLIGCRAQARVIVACCLVTDKLAMRTALEVGARVLFAASSLRDPVLLTTMAELLRTCRHDRAAHILTSREVAVLRGIAAGLTNKAIGRALYLATDTVKCHVSQLFRTLGARNRAHAVAIAYRRGLIG